MEGKSTAASTAIEIEENRRIVGESREGARSIVPEEREEGKSTDAVAEEGRSSGLVERREEGRNTALGGREEGKSTVGPRHTE